MIQVKEKLLSAWMWNISGSKTTIQAAEVGRVWHEAEHPSILVIIYQ